MSNEQEIGDVDLMDLTDEDQARARALRKSLKRLSEAEGANGALREMAKEVLAGNIGLREAVRVPAYSEAMDDRITGAIADYEAIPEDELARQREAASEYLEGLREEIKAEEREREASGGASTSRPRHSGHDWRL